MHVHIASWTIWSHRFVSYIEYLASAFTNTANVTSFERGMQHSSFFSEKVNGILNGDAN